MVHLHCIFNVVGRRAFLDSPDLFLPPNEGSLGKLLPTLITDTKRDSLLMDQKQYASSYVVPQVEARIQSVYGPLLFV